MTTLVPAPVLLPLVTALLLLLLPRRPRLAWATAHLSALTLLATAAALLLATADGAVLTVRLGAWSPSLGIVWVVDRLAAAMLAVSALVSFAALAQARAALPDWTQGRPFVLLHQLLMAGVNGSFVTGDLFNLFVFFEVLLIASFALMGLGVRARQLERGLPYLLVNLFGSVLLFVGVGVVYGTAGTVNLALLSERVAAGAPVGPFWPALALVLVVFATKAALAPVFTWLPDSYPEAVAPVSALFAGLLTKVGVYALFRVVPLVTGGGPSPIHEVLVVVATVTMAAGVVGALGRGGIRAILSFHIVSQVGYMVLGLAIGTPLALAAGLFYVVHHIVVKTALFLAGGAVEHALGSGRLAAGGGLARTAPLLAVAFLLPALSLAGLPPLSGFWGKFALVVAGFEEGRAVSAAVALVVSLLTLASMLKIWSAVFWGAAPAEARRPGWAFVAPAAGLAAVSVAIGLAAAPLFAWSRAVADELHATRPYVDAVLGTAAARAEAR